jgi:methylenetetrahydrofolate dehydrogenase (NAD+)
MLSNQAATIYSVDKNSILKFQPDGKIRREASTTTVEECVRKSSVIVSGVPSADFLIPTDWISDNAIVINVANVSNFDEKTLLEDRRGITYVPHVGRVTVAALESNLICLHRNYHKK